MAGGALRALLVVPANNTTMEGELREYCLELDELAVRPFAGRGRDLVAYGCTAASFIEGPGGDAEF